MRLTKKKGEKLVRDKSKKNKVDENKKTNKKEIMRK